MDEVVKWAELITLYSAIMVLEMHMTLKSSPRNTCEGKSIIVSECIK